MQSLQRKKDIDGIPAAEILSDKNIRHRQTTRNDEE